jgi:hypothetical protein
MSTVPCSCSYPCDCGGPVLQAQLAKAERDLAVDVLADHLRRQHLAAHDITGGLPWKALQTSEREPWLVRARATIDQERAA